MLRTITISEQQFQTMLKLVGLAASFTDQHNVRQIGEEMTFFLSDPDTCNLAQLNTRLILIDQFIK